MKEQYESLKELVAGLEEHIVKFVDKENNSAGTRLRKGLQEIRKTAQLMRVAVSEEKTKRKGSDAPQA